MKKLFIPLSLGLMCASFTIVPAAKTAHSLVTAEGTSHTIITGSTSGITGAGAELYTATNLQAHGLSEEAFNYAWKGYQKLLATSRLDDLSHG